MGTVDMALSVIAQGVGKTHQRVPSANTMLIIIQVPYQDDSLLFLLVQLD